MRKTLKIRYKWFNLLILVSLPLWAGTSGPARSGLEAFSHELDTLNAAFTQTVTAQDGSLESESSGEVWLKRPGLFRWSYGGDFPELIVADGEKVWLYDPTLEQVTVKEPPAEIGPTAVLLSRPHCESALATQFVT